MVARVEVYHSEIVAKNGEEVVGEGINTYNLRDFDPEVDLYKTKQPDPPGSISSLTLLHPNNRGRTEITTFPDQTKISLKPNIWGPGEKGDETIVSGRDSRGENPLARHVLGASGDILATITHLNQSETSETKEPQ